MRLEGRLYAPVAPASTQVHEYVVPADTKFSIEEIGGNAAIDFDTTVSVVWDYGGANTVLFSTHGDASQRPAELSFMGDGSKKLAILLVNDKASTMSLGAYWIGYY